MDKNNKQAISTMLIGGQMQTVIELSNDHTIIFDTSIKQLLNATNIKIQFIQKIFNLVYYECNRLNLKIQPCTVWVTFTDESKNDFLMSHNSIEPRRLNGIVIDTILYIYNAVFKIYVDNNKDIIKQMVSEKKTKKRSVKENASKTLKAFMCVSLAHEFTHCIFTNLKNYNINLNKDSLELLTDAIAYCSMCDKFKNDTYMGIPYLSQYLETLSFPADDYKIVKAKAYKTINEILESNYNLSKT